MQVAHASPRPEGSVGPQTPTIAASHALPPAALAPPTVGLHWDLAVEKLKEKPMIYEAFQEMRRTLSAVDDLPDGVIQAVKRHEESIRSRQWALPFKFRGKQEKVRQYFATVCKAVQVFKDFGSQIASLDPVHAGLPWAGACIVLQVALGNVEQTEEALEGLARVAPIVSRYAEIELIYCQNVASTTAYRDFESSMVDLYVSILEYQTAVACHCEASTFRHYLDSLPMSIDWASMIKSIQEKDEECQLYTRILQTKDARLCDKTLQGIVQDHQARFNIDIDSLKPLLRSDIQGSENEKILGWLRGLNPDVERRNILEDTKLGSVYADSGAWLLDDPPYKQWENCSQGTATFWIRGPAGTGKTCLTLSSIVVERYLSMAAANDDQRVLYFFCSRKRGQPSGSPPISVLCCLLYQLAWDPHAARIVRPIVAAWRRHAGRLGVRLDVDESIGLLKDVLSSGPHTTIIIDALDECAAPIELLQYLKAAVPGPDLAIHFFFSGRSHVKVSDVFCEGNVIDLETKSGVADDMGRFIRHEVEDSRSFIRLQAGGDLTLARDLEDKLISALDKKAQGCFRWVRLQLALFDPKIGNAHHPWPIETRIEKIGRQVGRPELDEVYDEIFQTNSAGGQRARDLLDRACKFLLGSWYSLKAPMLAEGVAIDPDGAIDPYVNEGYVLQLCKNLVVIDGQGTVQFAHLSVVEYLEQKLGFTPKLAHEQLGLSCLAALRHHPPPPPGRQANFFKYALLCWATHCQNAEERRSGGVLREPFEDFMMDGNDSFSNWALLYSRVPGAPDLRFTRRGPHIPMIYVSNPPVAALTAACHGFHEVLVLHWDRSRATLDQRDERGQSALHLAALYGQTATVRYILANGGDTTTNAEDDDRRTPLHHAARMDHTEIVRLLLEAGARLTAQDVFGETPLHGAAPSVERAIRRLALNAAAGVDAPDRTAQTDLSVCLRLVDEGSGKLLLEGGANLGQVDNHGSSASHHKADRKAPKVDSVALLLRGGADPDTRSLVGKTPLHCASSGAMVALMLDAGANPDVQDNAGNCPLHSIGLGHFSHHSAADMFDMLSTLLSRGANVHIQNNEGKTPLHVVSTIKAYVGWPPEAYTLLLSYGADPEAKDHEGNTPATILAQTKMEVDLEMEI